MRMTDTRTLLTERYEFRQRLVEDLVEDLQGPSTPDEVLDESPLDRYITGILWPAPSDEVETSSTDAEFMEHAESGEARPTDRKSTRLNSSHVANSYAVFCLKKKKI